ncbi:MBL fold metallo-hydrolase [Flammeovirgaceae bacterium SG7u.111]|nr:MBL fold metallo-hydrolase [Flammeovirgaceae bacterium SG7u.132]WPO36520.1 MBL fold metallo-hydrolase [Flammeovirgaceae bacterium SG7u.111]
MKLTFWGAARQVTGSMFLLEFDDDFRLLIDCGMDMRSQEEDMPAFPGSLFPFEASMVNAVLLTHAHLDHSGKIPNLYREGFEGKIFTTFPTRDLTKLLLYDSANLNRRKINDYHKKRSKIPNYEPKFNPETLFLEKHVDEAIKGFSPLHFSKRYQLTKNIVVSLQPTGHLLGAASVYLEVTEGGKKKSFLFSGDIGRKDYPLLQDPAPMPQADYLICETTYGIRSHESRQETETAIAQAVKEACVDKPGRLLIPAFSVGRTQAIIYTLHKLFAKKKLPPIRIFSDSPLGQECNKAYDLYTNYLNEDSQEFSEKHKGLFNFEQMEYVESALESKRLASKKEPAIIISSSGMLEGGRIQFHIRANIQNPNCTILMVGYSAEGTFGNQLLNMKNGMVELGQKNVPVLAKVIYTDAFSGHGDQNDLLEFVGYQDASKLKNIFLVHGEEESMEGFSEVLKEKGYQNVTMPEKGQSFEL